jgi:hypothetical protein
MKSIRLRRSVVGLVVTIALAAALFAVATPAKAAGLAGGSPWGSVDTFNGVPTFYAFAPIGQPFITGWAVDPDLKVPGSTPTWYRPSRVRADYIWYREMCKPFVICTRVVVVGQTSITVTAGDYRDNLRYSDIGVFHGFRFDTPPDPTSIYSYKKVCITALDEDGYGSDTQLGCWQLPY